MAILLAVRPAGAIESSIELTLNACGCTACPCPADSDAWANCDLPCHDHFCPLPLVCRHSCWYVQADALILNRTNGGDRPLAIAANTGDSVLETSDLALGFQPGPRLLIGHRTAFDRGWELSYFGLHEWSASAVAEDPNNLDIPGTLVLKQAIANAV